ncbi:MAG: hypothetical protein M0Z53_03345 [Thermaerobacter sp.]|nr:hypothetical protein [Thermaerobacter sp.]
MPSDFREWWQKLLSQDRPTLIRLGLVGLLGVLLMTFGSLGIPALSLPKTKVAAPPTNALVAQEAEVARQLAAILDKIPRVSSVSVAVTLSRSIQAQFAQQTPGGQGNGTTPVVVATASGQSVVPLDEIGPLVGGVVVVTPSAQNPVVRSELAQAVETLLQVEPYQVLILPN